MILKKNFYSKLWFSKMIFDLLTVFWKLNFPVPNFDFPETFALSRRVLNFQLIFWNLLAFFENYHAHSQVKWSIGNTVWWSFMLKLPRHTFKQIRLWISESEVFELLTVFIDEVSRLFFATESSQWEENFLPNIEPQFFTLVTLNFIRF